MSQRHRGSPEKDLHVTGEVRHDAGGQHRALRLAPVLQLAGEAADGPSLARRHWPRQRYAHRRMPGHAGITGSCPVPHPHGVPQRAFVSAGGPCGPARHLVIGMGVPVPRREECVETPGQFPQSCRHVMLMRGEPRVGQAEPDHLGIPGPECRQRRQRLGGPPGGDGLPLVRMGGLAVGECHDPQPGAPCGQRRDGAACAEHLVIRVRGHYHGARPPGGIHGWKLAQARPGAPGPFGRARRVYDVRVHVHHCVPCSATSAPSSARLRSA